MIRLISLEFMKLRKTRGFWLLASLFALALMALPVAAKYWLDLMTGWGENIGAFVPSKMPVFDFLDIWQNLAFIYKYFSILLGFLVLISVTNEFSYKTMRQNIIDGLSKREFLLSKLLWILVLAVVTTILIFLIGLIMGFAWSPVTEASFVFKNVGMLFGYFLHLVGFLLLCLFIALLVKRAGLAIALTVFHVYIVEPILTTIIRYKYELEMLADSFPYRASIAIVPNPFGKYILQEVQDYIPWENLLISLAYIALFVWLSWLLVSRRDL